MRQDPLSYLADELDSLKSQGLYRRLRVLEDEQRARAEEVRKTIVSGAVLTGRVDIANARIEFAAPRDLIGYERYAGYTSRLYDEAWPWGRFQAIPGLGTGDEGASRLADLAAMDGQRRQQLDQPIEQQFLHP